VTTAPALTVARVVLDSPLPQLDRLLDYRIPPTLVDEVFEGSLVHVPLRSGGRQTLAYVVEISSASDYAGRLSDVSDVVSSVSVLPRRLYDLARTVADRQAGTAADVLRLALPRRYVRAEKLFAARATETPVAVEPGEVVGVDQHAAPDARLAVTVPMSQRQNSRQQATTAWSMTMTQLARNAVASGASAILVVPDFRDIARVVADLEADGLADVICRLDAEVEPAVRWVNFLRCVRGDAVVVVGSRSAAYAPVARLGAFVVWDDGDPVLDEPMAPYAHPRDIALLRHQQEGGILAFLFLSPSAHVTRLIDIDWLALVDLSERPGPKVIPLDEESTGGANRIPAVAWQWAANALTYAPVLIQVPRPGFSQLSVCASCRERAQCSACSGPLRRANRGAVPDCRWCGRLATDITCVSCGAHEVADVAPGSTWTADIIGKSFPNVPIVVSDGERIVTSIAPTPQIVVATPGAEPFCPGGYSTVIILDADRQLYSDKMRVVENALRLWAHAIACCGARGRVFVQGAGVRLGGVLGSRAWLDYMRTEVVQRSELHLPPASRMAHISGQPLVVARALEALPENGVYSVLGPMPDGEAQVRATVLFSYARGSDVTQSLRASVVTAAAARKRPGATPALRVRLDDAHVGGHVG